MTNGMLINPTVPKVLKSFLTLPRPILLPFRKPSLNKKWNWKACSYTIDREGEALEMVVDDKGETWVNYWSVWKGTMAANDKTYETPIHITSQFVNGKIVKAFGYWNNAPLQLDVMALKMAAEKAAMEAVEEENKAIFLNNREELKNRGLEFSSRFTFFTWMMSGFYRASL